MKTQTKDIDSFTDETLTCFEYSLLLLMKDLRYKMLEESSKGNE